MRKPARLTVTERKTWTGKNPTRMLIMKSTAAFLLFVFATILLHGNWPVALTWMSGGLGIWVLWSARQHRRARAAILGKVDAMTPEEFARYTADLLHAQGYTVHRTFDRRVDLLLTRGRESFACRLQRQQKKIGEDIVADALAGVTAHGCGRAMVLTNHLFTYRARSLARREGCVLIDRESLADLVAQYRQGHRVLVFQ
ncbi:MAG: restriction endonuclease, partial [Candidatus Binatia bacterium]